MFPRLRPYPGDSLLEASEYVQIIESHQGLKVACLEEIAWYNGWISDAELLAEADVLAKADHGRYLKRLVRENLS